VPDLPHSCQYEGKYYKELNGLAIEISEYLFPGSQKTQPYEYNEQFAQIPPTLSEADAESMIRKGMNKAVYFIHRDIETLPEIQAALGNSGGGYIFFGVKKISQDQPGEILGFTEDEIDKLKIEIDSKNHPQMPIKKLSKLKIENKTILVQYIPTNLPDIFRFNDKFPGYDGKIIQNLNNKDAMDILRDKKEKILEPIFTVPKPTIRRLTLEWIEFPSNQEYNPETNCLEWINLAMEEEKNKVGQFACVLNISLNKAKELFEKKNIKGKVEIDVNNVLLSNTSLNLYDALGNSKKISWRGLTKLESELTFCLPEILKRRPYFPWRSISIVGIEPNVERVRDIIRALNDAGIMTGKAFYIGRSRSLEDGVEVLGKKQGQYGITQISCIIKGKRSQVTRELRTGHRTDNKELISGILEVEFSASTEDSHLEVMRILNEVADNIKNRFNYLRVE
jgi:hypothetical protein